MQGHPLGDPTYFHCCVEAGSFGGLALATNTAQGCTFFVYGTSWRHAESAALGPVVRFLWPTLVLIRPLVGCRGTKLKSRQSSSSSSSSEVSLLQARTLS